MLCLPHLGRADGATDDFNAGVKAFQAADYKKAEEIFTKLSEKSISADLFYNLGCVKWKLDKLGEAYLWLDRSRTLKPTHIEAWQNLRYLRTSGIRFEYNTSGWEMFASFMKPSTWSYVFWGCVWALVLALAAILFLARKRRWPLVVLGCLALLGAGVAGTGMMIRKSQISPDQIKIVTASEVKATTAPADSGDEVIELPEGSQVRQLQELDGWSYVETPGERKTRGWVKTSALTPLWPWDAALVL
jgi:TPR repeat protein